MTNTTANVVGRTHFIAMGNNHGWGKGTSQQEAIRNMKRQGGKVTRYAVYHCSKSTYVNDMGGFNRPCGDPEAVEVLKVGF